VLYDNALYKSTFDLPVPACTSSSAMAERPRELGDFKGVRQFEAEGLIFAPISMDP